jgi:tetratricopeptide (TPR) repeat protein
MAKKGAYARIAEKYERRGDVENAVRYYKKAAMDELRIRKEKERRGGYKEIRILGLTAPGSGDYLKAVEYFARAGDEKNAREVVINKIYPITGDESAAISRERNNLNFQITHIVRDVQNRLKEKRGERGLAGKVIIIISISSFILALFFFSTNITGNAIGNLTSSNSNIIGICLLVIGLVMGYLWMNGK